MRSLKNENPVTLSHVQGIYSDRVNDSRHDYWDPGGSSYTSTFKIYEEVKGFRGPF